MYQVIRLAKNTSFRARELLSRLQLYRKIVIGLGRDSRYYNSYYKNREFSCDSNTTCSDVDGYGAEGGQERIVRLVDNLLDIVPNPSSVLDLGCGTGRYLKEFSKSLPDACLEGADISRGIVETFTRKQVPDIPIHILDVEQDEEFTRQNAGEFELVCLIGIIQVLAVRKLKSILEKVRILCTDGGYVYLQFNVETRDKKSTLGYRRYSIEELTRTLTECGFDIVRAEKTDILKDYAYIIAQRTPSSFSVGPTKALTGEIGNAK